jgi:catechol 2,3-dioxygenase-like lactoylglutathione lyase family enzyme
VRDLERSALFYTDVLGLPKVREIPDDGRSGAKVLCAAGADHERDRDDPALRASYPVEGSSVKV